MFMAAYPALVSLTRLVDQILQNDQQYFPIPLLYDRNEQQILKSLHEKLCLLLDFLECHSHNCNETVDLLAGRIRDSAHNIEDLIESHISNHIPSEYGDNGFNRASQKSLSSSPKNQIPSAYEGKWQGLKIDSTKLVSSLKKALSPRKQLQRDAASCFSASLLGEKLEDLQRMTEEIDSILEAAEKINGSSTTNETTPLYGSSRQEASGNNKMVGFEADSMKLKEWLCSDSSGLQIFSIVGMGGSGKTTLAKNVFDDSLVPYYFHKRAWVTISQDYSPRYVLVGLLNSLVEKTEDYKEKSDDMLKEKVYKTLKGCRYLIVMDDIWSRDVWDDFRRIFPHDGNGSRVIITTRILDVAVYVDESLTHFHHMQCLDEDQSWNLLKEKVFAEDVCPQELVRMGKKIATKCGGLPLALVLAAGLLSEVLRTPHEWEKFSESVNSILAKDDEHFLKIMSLSYDHLPHHLRPCFLYIGGFREDYEIPVFKLLQLWIAEGFVRSIESKGSEQVAREYLEDLVRRNLVLVTKKSTTGKHRFCRIHDLLRDFCIEKAQNDSLFHVNKHLSIGAWNKRRVFLSRQNSWDLLKVLGNVTGLNFRSIVLSTHYFATELPSLVAKSKLLRVFEGLEVEMSSSCIHHVTKLCHLRYLSFYPSSLEEFVVPTSICRLRNLNTLIIQANPSFPFPHVRLPSEIWRMPQLRHLVVSKGCFLPHPSPKSSILKNLQTLTRIIDFTFNSKCIEMIPNVKKLGIIYTELYSSIQRCKYHIHTLINLNHLESLNLRIHSIETNDFPVDFAFPRKLRKLSLHGCTFPWEKMTIIGSLTDLEVLKLNFNAFRGVEWVTKEDEFRRLKSLLLDSISVVYWRAESDHFPSLERLIVRKCPYLQEIPSGIGDIMTLQLIEVEVGFPGGMSAADSALRIQKEQQEMGNDLLQVRIVRH